MSNYKNELKDISNLSTEIKITIIISDFNSDETKRLLQENIDFLQNNWFKNIEVFHVPWAFEIPGFVSRILKNNNSDLIITLWVVVRWETTHYESVAFETGRWVMELSIKNNTPIIFWVLTCENFEQVEKRINVSASISGLNLLSEVNKLKNV